jgi:transposase
LQEPFRILSSRLIKGFSSATQTGSKTKNMSKFTKKKEVIGIDISKDYIDAALLREQNLNHFISERFTNDLEGFETMKTWCTRHKVKLGDCLFCMEHTGNYGLLLFAWLSQQGADFCVEPGMQIKRSQGMTRGKGDQVDAQRIALYAMNRKAQLIAYKLPSEDLIRIKQLLTYRDQLVRTRTSLKNSLQSHQKYEEIIHWDYVTKDIQMRIANLNDSIEQLEKQIKEIIQSDNGLKNNFKMATSVKGIGLVIAAFMLVTTNNFSSFDNGRKYACYSGIAPFPHNSGTSIKGKTQVSYLANRRIKTLLANGANSAKRYDPEIRTYYNRKISEGKDHKLVINAISCKLVNRVFSAVKRQSPYVEIYRNNFA